MAYVDSEYVAHVAAISSQVLDGFISSHPGSFEVIANSVSRMFDSMLHKRYATPFDPDDTPEAVKWNVAQVVAYQVWLKVGFDPGSQQDELLKEARDNAIAWVKEAADSKEGNVELPAREDPSRTDASAADRTRPLAYSDVTPYDWVRRQAERARRPR